MPKALYIPSIPEALRVMHGQARIGVKYAEIGGGQDTPFEQAFSNVAHAYLKDKAPALLDYEVGFQLIDRNQENTKAVGIFGFKAGPQWLYGPVFFLNGDVKGHELLYIKNQDMFVPMKENWLNYILNRRPNVLGQGVDKNLSNIGVMAPNLSQLSKSPSKFASAYDKRPTWAKDSLAACAYWATVHPKNDPKYHGILDLPAFLKEAGYKTLVALFKTFEQYPRVKAAYDQFHSMAVIEQAIAEAKRRVAEEHSNSVLKESASCRVTPDGVRCADPRSVLEDEVEKTLRPKKKSKPGTNPALAQAIKEAKGSPVAFHTYDDVLHTGTKLEGMSKDDREKLLRDKVLIRDKRPDPEVSKVYEVQTQVKLFNPDKTGLFDVLIKPGEFVKCLVLMWPFSNKRRQTWCTVVRLDGNKGKGKSWLNVHPSQVWCGKHYPNDAFSKWVDEQDEADGDKVKKGGLFVLFNDQGSGSTPFEADREVMSGLKSYHVAFNDYALKGRAGWLPEVQDERPSHDMFMDDTSDSSPRITFTGKDGSKLRCTGADLMVPNGFKLLMLKDAPEDMTDEETGKKDKPPFSSAPGDSETGAAEEKDQELLAAHVSDPAPLYLGDMRDIDYLVGTKTAAMKVAAAGSEVIINGHRMTKLAGLIHLVRDHGLREKQARAVLARAEVERIFKCRIKYADQYYDLQKNGPSAPTPPEPMSGFDPMTGGRVPTMQPSEQYMQVPDMSASKTDRSVYSALGPEPDYQNPSQPDRDAQRAALDAARTGQKEIFDTTMIGGLLKAVRDDNLVDRYRGDLLKGLDRLGRILFLFYWHNEKFAERYGQQDMVELEDGLRNAFESMGDIVLFLMQRSVDPHNDNLDGVDLGDVASA
jgi:hypothetical protein